jgi:hypothetical protein
VFFTIQRFVVSQKVEMVKHLIVIATLVVLVFILGCTPVESEQVQSVEPQIRNYSTEVVEPGNAMSSEGITGQLEPDKIETIEFQLDSFEPVVVEANEPEPPKVEIVEPEPVVSEPNEIPVIERIDVAAFFHDKFSVILNNFIDDRGMVHYKKLRRQRLKLKALIREFDTLNPDEFKNWTKDNKIAFWLNAYNIQMLKVITDNYPIQSSRILRLYPGWGPNSILHIKGIWSEYKFLVMDEEFTLSEIDKRILRRGFDDPRIFFALFRGSLSGPPLRNEPYYGHRLNEQLDDQVRRFLSNPLAFKIDTEKKTVYLSSLFQVSSYGREFLAKYATDKKFKDHDPNTRAVLNFITNYVSQDVISFLELGNYSIKYMKYDWTINDGS